MTALEDTLKFKASAPYSKVLLGLPALVAAAGGLYVAIGQLSGIGFLSEYARAIRVIQLIVAFGILGFGLLGLAVEVIEIRAEVRARAASNKVAQALNDIKGSTNIAEINPEEVAKTITGTNVSNEQVKRLVEQHQQDLLIDPQYLGAEVNSLIVDYLQPVPRNAKRLRNRFAVNLLIASGRGLLTTEPKLSGKQIGKWLVLMERWPQLGRVLGAVPEKMEVLEKESLNPPAAAGSSESDPFMQSIKDLAPAYFGDEDLRKFFRSSPALVQVVTRLAQYEDTTSSAPVRPLPGNL